MDSNLEKAFKSLGETDSFDSLQSRIVFRVGQIQERRTKIRLILSRTIGVFSFVAVIPVIINLFVQLQTSGFWNYLSLLFTDTSVVATYWKEFSLSLTDAIPFFTLTLVLALVMSLFISFKFALKDFKRIGLSANLA